MKIIFENRQALNEDKVVKFGGQTFPKFGWAVILMGGGGSGKSTVFNSLVPIEGKYVNVDDLKEHPRFWDIKKSGTDMTYYDEIRRTLDKPNISNTPIRQETKGWYFGQDKNTEEPTHPMLKANLSEPEIANAVHQSLRPLGKAVKKAAYDTPKSASEGKLPNIIFDIVADELKDITTVVEQLKPAGYKIAIIWVSSTINKALKNNAGRDRVVSPDIIIGAHGRVLDTLNELFDSGYIRNIDEFWVINTAIAKKYFGDKATYHDYQNVFQIPTTPDGLKTFIQKYSGNPHWNQSWNSETGKTYEKGKALNLTGRMKSQKREINRREKPSF